MTRIQAIPTLAALALSLVLSACETTVDPFIEDDRFFTIFGYLDTATDLQAVRVIPLRTTIGSSTADIDATVTTTEVETGRVIEWTDSIIEFDDGSSGHVYRGAFRPIPGFSYRMEVVRSDGASTHATTSIPPAEGITVDAPTISQADAWQRVFWSEIPADPFRIEVWYRFMGTRPSDPFVDAVITYQDVRYGNPKNGGWEILVRLSEDRLKVSQQLDVAQDAGLTLMGVGARLTMSDEGWRPPGGAFDREVLVQPGTFSNVEGGFGFFGAVNQFTAEWTLPPSITERIGYNYPSAPAD